MFQPHLKHTLKCFHHVHDILLQHYFNNFVLFELKDFIKQNNTVYM